jgi:chemotaxis methyl-accepting protein methylase
MTKEKQDIFAHAWPMADHPYFGDPNRVRFDERWREKHANKHRPSACGGLGKALAKIRHPSSLDLGIREFNHNQALRVPTIEEPNSEETESTKRVWEYKPEDDGLYSPKTIMGDEGVLLNLNNQNTLVHASYGMVNEYKTQAEERLEVATFKLAHAKQFIADGKPDIARVALHLAQRYAGLAEDETTFFEVEELRRFRKEIRSLKKMPTQTELDPRITELYPRDDFVWFLTNHPKLKDMPIERQLDEYRLTGMSSYTWFHREPLVMNTFRELVLPSFPEGKMIRVASVGCSFGAEPYDILLSNWAQRDRLTIDAFDCNLDTLELAMEMKYCPCDEWTLEEIKDRGKNKIEEACDITLDPEARFVKYKLNLKPETKKRVNFEPLDVFSGKLPGQYDVVFLLNVLKYYQPKGRAAILQNIHDSLPDEGWLLGEPKESHRTSEEYRGFMQDLSTFGFEKQNVVLPSYKDVTEISRVYRKRL